MEATELTTIITGIVFYFAGVFLVGRLSVLRSLNIPAPIAGGLLGSLLLFAAHVFGLFEVQFPSKTRDFLLVLFFVSVGLSVRLPELIKGGWPLSKLALLAILLVLAQNAAGILVATAWGEHPVYGLLGGSVSFVGGFGSSIAWGKEFERQGLAMATEVALACSTLGLVAGALLAGPAIAWLVDLYGLAPPALAVEPNTLSDSDGNRINTSVLEVVFSLLLMLLSLALGDFLNTWLASWNITLPRFLTAMIVAIIIGNMALCAPIYRFRDATDFMGEVSLNIFVATTLLTVKLWSLGSLAGVLLILVTTQILITLLFSWLLVFRFMGKDYEAGIMAGGTVGYGLSSFAVAIATVETAQRRYGPAPRAYLLISLVGAAIVDLANSLLIKLFSLIPGMWP